MTRLAIERRGKSHRCTDRGVVCYRAIEILIKNDEKQVLITAEVYSLPALEA